MVGSIARAESTSRATFLAKQIFSRGAVSDRPTLVPEKESLLSASPGPLRRAIHWFGGGILSECKTENAPMTKAPAAVERNDDQGAGCRACRARYSSMLITTDMDPYSTVLNHPMFTRGLSILSCERDRKRIYNATVRIQTTGQSLARNEAAFSICRRLYGVLDWTQKQ
jgi:hypothetical protein